MSDQQVIEVPEFLMTDNTIYLAGEITNEKTDDLIKFITSANCHNLSADIADRYISINLFVNSHGGDMEATFALISAMRASVIPIITVAIGACASGALMICISGNTRLIDKYCTVMSHTLSTGYPEYAKPSDLERWLASVHLSKQMMIDLYIENTRLSEEYIVLNLLPSDGDAYMTSKQAISYNLFDDYFTSYDQLGLQ